jgi:hypothetical protein
VDDDEQWASSPPPPLSLPTHTNLSPCLRGDALHHARHPIEVAVQTASPTTSDAQSDPVTLSTCPVGTIEAQTPPHNTKAINRATRDATREGQTARRPERRGDIGRTGETNEVAVVQADMVTGGSFSNIQDELLSMILLLV